jgi:hypothetical protein
VGRGYPQCLEESAGRAPDDRAAASHLRFLLATGGHVMRHALIPLAILLIAAAPQAKPAAGPGSGGSISPTVAEATASQEAGRYVFRLEDGRDPKLKLEPRPILRWSDPPGGIAAGAAYLWTARGRPEAIATITIRNRRAERITVEFHLLSTTSYVVQRAGNPVWMPKRPGVAIWPTTLAPVVSRTPSGRLDQMSKLARSIVVEAETRTMVEAKKSTTKAKTKTKTKAAIKLRVLPRPIFRYQVRDPALLDGAIFAFAAGDDPQALLILEARAGRGGHHWWLGFARLNSIHLTAKHKQLTLWNAPAQSWHVVFDRTLPDTMLVPRPAAED